MVTSYFVREEGGGQGYTRGIGHWWLCLFVLDLGAMLGV